MFLLKNVTYKDILNIQHLSIPKHQVTCIIGESGSGKSTLLKLLNKLVSYDSGEILYNNQSIQTINAVELRREVVMLPQNPAIWAGSIKDNLMMGLTFSNKPGVSDDKLSAVLKMINLNKSLTYDAERLSGGEKQRVALARVILMEPEILLLDEPSSALDESTEHTIIKSLVALTKSTNKTLIMVTHSKQVATRFSDYIIEIKNGHVINQGGVDNEWCN